MDLVFNVNKLFNIALSYVPLVINSIKNCSFCSFDFAGSGNSEGEYVSLGYY